MDFLRRKFGKPASKPLNSHEKTLFVLIQKKDYDQFQQILDSEKINLNMRDQQGNTLLIHSVEDDTKILFTKYLLEKGADINAMDNKGMSALFKATYWGEKETVKLLVTKKGIELDRENQVFDFSLNPITAAIFKNHTEVLKTLLYNGADLFKAEQIILKEHAIFKDAFNEKCQEIMEFYKRWHQGKKQILMAYYVAKNRKSIKKSSSKLYDVGLLPRSIVVRIAAEFL